MRHPHKTATADLRMRGFAQRHTVEEALAWLDAQLELLPPENIPLRLAAGRVLGRSDDDKPGAHPVAVMNYAFWERRFARDPRVVGQTVAVNGGVLTIIGAPRPDDGAVPT